MVGHARSVEYTRLESAKGLYLFHFFNKLTIYHASLATIQRLKLKGYIKQTFLSVEFLQVFTSRNGWKYILSTVTFNFFGFGDGVHFG